MENKAEKERLALETVLQAEALAEKKAAIYAKLLTEQGLAKSMEEIAMRHAKRRETLMKILGEETQKGESRYGGNAYGDET